MNVGIIGASGYSGEVLVGLLARHPRATLAAVTSRSLAGQRVEEVLPSLRGRLGDLAFTASDPAACAARGDIAVWFLALPHGVAAEYARPLVDAGSTVLDLSADFRLDSPETYAAYYGGPHPDPALLAEAAYVIPELAPDGWQEKKLLACPGCYPTSILVPLVPLLRAGVLSGEGIVVNSFSGVSGAGKKAAEFYSFTERAESALAYGAPRHRHLSEVEEQLAHAAGHPVVVQFTPHLAPMRRGIATTIVAPAGGHDLDAVYAAWNSAYAERPFVQVLPSGTFPETGKVAFTNRIDLSAVHDERTGNLLLFSAEDNLLKGASGQAVQLFNLLHGFGETDGLV